MCVCVCFVRVHVITSSFIMIVIYFPRAFVKFIAIRDVFDGLCCDQTANKEKTAHHGT